MAAKSVIQFVLGQFAKRSARKTGIPKILNANDSIVQSNALSIENILKNDGYDPSKMSSDDILKAMNYHKAMMNQKLTQQFKGLGLSKGVDDLAKKDPFQGFTPKIVPKDKTLLRDSPEAIAKIKADNKAALERLKNKKKTVEDFSDDGDFDPSGMASGGLARVGYAGGGRILKWLLSLGSKKPKSMFEIEELAKKQNIIKKDEVIIKQEGRDSKTGKDIIEYDVYKKSDKKRPPTEEELDDKYGELWNDEQSPWDFGSTIDELDYALKEQRDYAADMYRQYQRGELEKYVKPEVLEESRLLRQKKIDKVLDKAYDEIAGGSGFSDDYKMAADELSDSIAEQLGKGEFSDLSQMYQTDIYNTALKRVTGDLKKRLSKPTKTLEGIKKKGTIDISDPEVADEFSRFMKESDPEGYKKLEQQIQLDDFDVTGRKKNAYGGIAGQLHMNEGGRASFTKGGKVSSGLANILGV